MKRFLETENSEREEGGGKGKVRKQRIGGEKSKKDSYRGIDVTDDIFHSGFEVNSGWISILWCVFTQTLNQMHPNTNQEKEVNGGWGGTNSGVSTTRKNWKKKNKTYKMKKRWWDLRRNIQPREGESIQHITYNLVDNMRRVLFTQQKRPIKRELGAFGDVNMSPMCIG